MKNIPIYQVDAFAQQHFQGNPAAICPLQQWLDDALLQSIAKENNLSETAFFVASDKPGKDFQMRWFTPAAEVKLCGHATLASAHVLFKELGFEKSAIVFDTLSGDLIVSASDPHYQMDFPAYTLAAGDIPDGLVEALGRTPLEVLKGGEDCIVVFESSEDIAGLKPNFELLAKVDARGVGVTAPADATTGVDFVSRFFAPRHGINEDPVTGSLHCALAPLWAERLDKSTLIAQQLSSRGGQIHCQLVNGRVLLAGPAITFLRGEIFLDISP